MTEEGTEHDDHTQCHHCERCLTCEDQQVERLTAQVKKLKSDVQAVCAENEEGWAEVERLKEELAQRAASFDLRWKADMRAIKRWKEAGPDRDLTWPDHADLCVWLLEEIERLKAGKFTPDELQGLCHGLTEEDEQAFNSGCLKYQEKLFGRSMTLKRMQNQADTIIDLQAKLTARAALIADSTQAMAGYRAEIKRLKEELKETKAKERKAMSLFRAAIAQNKTPTP